MVIYRVRDVPICVSSGKKNPKGPERKTPWSVFMLSSHLLFDCRFFTGL